MGRAFQLGAIEVLVISVATLFFAFTIASPIMTPLFGAISLIGIIVAIDGWKIKNNSCELAAKLTHFLRAQSIDKELTLQKKVYKNTSFLGPLVFALNGKG